MSSKEKQLMAETSGRQVRNRMIRQLADKQIRLTLAGEEKVRLYSVDVEKSIERAGGETLVMISNGRNVYAAKSICSYCGCDIPRLSAKNGRTKNTKMCPICSNIYNNFATLKTRAQQGLVQKLEGQSVVRETTEEKARFIMRDAAERRSNGEEAWIDAFRCGNRWFVCDLRKVFQWAIKHLSKRTFKTITGERFVEYLMYYKMKRIKDYKVPQGAAEWSSLYACLPDDF